MRLGILTSYQTQCGIAQYSRNLSRAFVRAGIDTTVLASRNYGSRALPKELTGHDDPTVLPCFDVQMWSPEGQHGLDIEEILGLDLDVLHVQYEVVLFHRQLLQQLLNRFDGITAITWHDNCIPIDMPGPWDIEFRHRDDTGPKGQLIPFGVENIAPVVRTFGLGRSQEATIRPICDKHGWRFESSFGERRWKRQDELHDWLRGADAIVLWYPEAPMAGSSQAARTALATRRPLIINDVAWFRDIPTTSAAVRKVDDTPLALEAALVELLAAPYIEGYSWDRVAELHLDAYANARHSLAA